jgi:hypothetical protein
MASFECSLVGSFKEFMLLMLILISKALVGSFLLLCVLTHDDCLDGFVVFAVSRAQCFQNPGDTGESCKGSCAVTVALLVKDTAVGACQTVPSN